MTPQAASEGGPVPEDQLKLVVEWLRTGK